jgi:hypothetical protein
LRGFGFGKKIFKVSAQKCGFAAVLVILNEFIDLFNCFRKPEDFLNPEIAAAILASPRKRQMFVDMLKPDGAKRLKSALDQ